MRYNGLADREKGTWRPGRSGERPPSKKGGEAMTVMEVLTLLNLIATVILVAVTANKDSK